MPIPFKLPKWRGSARASTVLAKTSNALGFYPIGEVRMRMGHKMILDTRAHAEQKAYFTGAYKDEAVKILAELAAPNSTVLDIGAHVGLITVPLRRLVRSKRVTVCAFEPYSANITRLIQNLRLNHLSDNTIFPFALSAQSGHALLTLREDHENGASTSNASIQIEDGEDQNRHAISIHTHALDDVLAQHPSIATPSVIKLDIEGHEDQFLLGAGATIALHRPIIFSEVNTAYFKRKHISFDAAIAPLRAIGYSAILHHPRLSLVDNLDALEKIYDVWLVPAEHLPALRRAASSTFSR